MIQLPTKAGGGNLVRLIGLLSLALGVFALLVGGAIMYASIQGQLDSQQASNAAQNEARAIGDSLAEIQAAIENPQVIGLARDLLGENRTRSDALEAAVQRRGVPNIIDLKVFPNEVESIELGEYPEPDFTVIEMLREARAEGQAPIQVHYPGQSIENLALAQAVEMDAGVEGIIFLRVPVSMASSLLTVPSFIDSVAIVQGQGPQSYTIRSFGQLTEPMEVSPIPGSQLSLRWTRATFASSFSKRTAVIILSIGIILLMVGILVRQRFGVLDTKSLASERKTNSDHQAKAVQADEASSSARKPVARKKTQPSRPVRRPESRKTPGQAAAADNRKKKIDQPVVDDLPDWLLDSDQIDQSDAPLGGHEDDLPELPDTLSDRDDDKASKDKGSQASGSGQVEDTLLFDPEEDELFEAEDAPSSDSRGAKAGRSGNNDVDLNDLSGTAADPNSKPMRAGSIDSPVGEDDSELDIDWDDFNSEVDSEELLTGNDEEAIDAALAELDEPGSDHAASGQSDAVDKAEQNGSDELRSKSKPSDLGEQSDASNQPNRSSGEPVLHPSLFMANSIGGVVGEHLDSRAATLIGEAIGSEAASRGVDRMVIGRDGRLDGPVLMSSLSQGLQSAGIHVIDLGAVPIPVLNFAATELTSGSGVMVTGSHYPATHNGFRIRIKNELLSDSGIQTIQRRINTQDLVSGSGGLEEDSVIERYLERIGTDIQLERPLKVVVDCGNGIAGSVVPSVLSAIGADVIPLYADVDGSFPNHLPDPSRPENLEDLKLCVRNFHADLGLAFDGDGDRLAAISGDGKVVWTDRLLMLLAPEILERNAGARVIIDSASSRALSELIQAAGGKPLVERSAEAFVEQRMRKESALLGGLFSGHLFIAERWFPFDDAIYASARLLEVLAADTRSTAEIFGQLPETEGTSELRVSLDSERAEELITELIAEGNFGEAELSMVDGLRADYPDGWGMVRASHQSRGLVLRFEADSNKALKRIKTIFSRQIAARESKLKLPF